MPTLVRPPTRAADQPSPTRVAAAGAIAFLVTLIVLLSLGAGVYRIWLSQHPESGTTR